MKPVYLEFCGLNSFSSKAEIDFSALLSGGIFGIFGATGSGKSSILDAIHLALYGKVDRVATFNDCINQNSDGVSVSFDFEVVVLGKRGVFRVRRETKRKSGSAKAYLYEKRDGEWFALAEGVNDVNKKVEEIVGLSFEDFKTCIALPQGDFAALVKSKLSERVKLMARLFNLEKYGEKMYKAVNAKYAEAETDVKTLCAQMGENEGADEEKIALAKACVAKDEEETAKAQEKVKLATERYQVLQNLQKEKRAYEQATAQFLTLQSRYDEMQEMQNLLVKYSSARAVADAHTALLRAKQTTGTAKQNLTRASAECARISAEKQTAKQRVQESDVEERLLQAKMDLQTVRASVEDIQNERTCLQKLEDCKKEYRECRFEGLEEDYDAVRTTLEQQYEALGEDEDLIAFLKKNLKGVMLSETYGEVRADLRAIAEKHPQTQSDIEVLIQKYRLQNQTELNVDEIASAQLRFKQAEQKRKQIRAQLDALEKRQQAFKSWQDTRKEIQERGKLLQEAHKMALEKITAVRALGDENSIVKKIAVLQAEKDGLQKTLERAQALENDCVAKCKQWEGAVQEYGEREKEYETAFSVAIKESGLASVDEAQTLLARIGDERTARERTNAFFERYAICKAQVESVDAQKFITFDEREVENALLIKDETEREAHTCAVRLGTSRGTLARLLIAQEKYAKQQKELEEKQKRLNVCEELRSLVHGNKFLEFVASEYLQEICLSASKTLLSLTNRKYFLKYVDKEFKVGDN
ncbi:MAG: SMC family ATPase [Clostridia bacterium]|nr:SMC family ATPase [Clostridia bacterium]